MTRTPVLAAALVAVLAAVPAPASAQEPSPSASPCNDPDARVTVSVSPSTVTAGDPATVTVSWTGALDDTYTHAGNSYRWRTPSEKAAPEWVDLSSLAPPEQVADGETATRTVTLRPTTSTRVVLGYGYRSGCLFADGQGGGVVAVRDHLGPLTAVRHGVRDYTFTAPFRGGAGKAVNLYRVLPDGRQVLTAQTRSTADSATVRRAFTGSGRFGFLMRSGSNVVSLGTSTPVRPTVVH